MKSIIIYKDLQNNSDDIRNRLVKLMYANPISLALLAKKIRISSLTLQYFLEEINKTEKWTMFKILKYVQETEEELKDK